MKVSTLKRIHMSIGEIKKMICFFKAILQRELCITGKPKKDSLYLIKTKKTYPTLGLMDSYMISSSYKNS